MNKIPTMHNAAPAATNTWLHKCKHARAAVVTAHPDDEVLWAGGLLSWWRTHGTEPITVHCCSIPATEPERASKFFDVCRYFKAFGRLNPYIEIRGGHLRGLDKVELQEYDIIFTHNRIGEYGHTHHVDVHEYVTKTFPGTIYMFGYGASAPLNVQFQYSEKENGIRLYNHISALMNVPKHVELIDRWGNEFDLSVEKYERYVR